MAHLKQWVTFGALLAAPVAQADPVSIIGGAIGALAGGTAVGGALLGGIAGFLGMSVSAVGFAAGSLLFGTANAKRKQRKAMAAARDAYNAGLQDRTVTALSTAAPWQIIYGQATVGGSLEAILTSGDRDQYKHLVVVFAAHACEAIVDVQINGESLGALNGSGAVTTGKWFKSSTNTYTDVVNFDGAGVGTLGVAGATLISVVGVATTDESFSPNPEAAYPGATLVGTTINGGPISAAGFVTYTKGDSNAVVRVQKHLGDDAQAADATLLAECSDQWSASDRLRGLTYVVVRLDLNEPEFQSGPPNITATIKGKKVYDHRTNITAWSQNPALCVADFLMAPYGKNVLNAHVAWDTVDAAANACDQVITVGTWTGARYRCDGSFRTDAADPDEVLEQLLASMAGWADGSGGWRIGAGVWTAPVGTLTDDDNAGPVQVVGGDAIDELFNGVRGQFADPARGGVATDFTPYQNATFAAADGRALWSDMALPFTTDATRATNLARIAVESARGETLSYPAKLAVINRFKVGDRLAVSLPALSIAGTYYRVQARDETPGGQVLLTLKQDAAGNYDTIDAEIAAPAPVVPMPDPFVVPPPVGLSTVTGTTTALVTGGTVVPRILVSVTGQPEQATDQLQVEWRNSAAIDWLQLQLPMGQQGTYLSDVTEGLTYIVRARWYRPIVGAYSDWRVTSCKVDGKQVAPPNFDTFTVQELDSRVRRFSFAYGATAQPADWVGAEIRYIAGTVPSPTWSAMTPLNVNGQAFPASPVELSGPGVGTWTFACRSRDSGGLSTTMRVVTLTLGPPPGVYAADNSNPPTPTGVVLTPGLTAFYVAQDAPVYTQGHGHLKSILYGVEYTGGPLPTFADARQLAEFTGQTVGQVSAVGTTWRVWVKWQSNDGTLSTVAAGGVNGFAVTTGLVNTPAIESNAVTMPIAAVNSSMVTNNFFSGSPSAQQWVQVVGVTQQTDGLPIYIHARCEGYMDFGGVTVVVQVQGVTVRARSFPYSGGGSTEPFLFHEPVYVPAPAHVGGMSTVRIYTVVSGGAVATVDPDRCLLFSLGTRR